MLPSRIACSASPEPIARPSILIGRPDLVAAPDASKARAASSSQLFFSLPYRIARVSGWPAAAGFASVAASPGCERGFSFFSPPHAAATATSSATTPHALRMARQYTLRPPMARGTLDIERYTVAPGSKVNLAKHDPDDDGGLEKGKKADKLLAGYLHRLCDLQ